MNDRTIPTPVCSRKNNPETINTLFGQLQSKKRCKMCRAVLIEGIDFYQPGKSMEYGYAVCIPCWDLKKKYSSNWKRAKNRILKSLRSLIGSNVKLDYRTRRDEYEKIFRNEGYDNFFD